MPSSSPLVSVLMTAYNREKYISEAIESVLSSTFTDFELIIVDDCSVDNTLDIAKNYESQDNRIVVYQNGKNLGDYPNRNVAASYAKGKYLKYIDADDMVYKHGLELMVKNMQIFPDAGWGVMSLIQDDDRIFPFQLSCIETYQRNYLNKSPYVNNSGIFLKAPLSAIIKKEAFFFVRGFKPIRHFGDSDLWHRLAMYYPVVLMQDGLVWWRGHDDQEAVKRKSNYSIYFETVNNFIENINHQDCPLTQSDKLEVIKKLNNKKLKVLLRDLKHMKFKKFFKSFRYL